MPELSGTRLVGGTSLALQYGHRRSTDLVFFGEVTIEPEELVEAFKEKIDVTVLGAHAKHIMTFFLNSVKVDIVNYRYPWIDQPLFENHLRLASPKDIAAMKVNAIIGRGTKKDFIDIYYLLQHYSFKDLIHFYLHKYQDGSEYRALLSMAYFGDADPQPAPYMFEKDSWENIKDRIRHEVDNYNQMLSKRL